MEFEPGATAFSGAALKKVETVAKIMYERPGLQIDLEGHADPARERDLLLKARLTEIIKAQKAKEPPKKGKETTPQAQRPTSRSGSRNPCCERRSHFRRHARIRSDCDPPFQRRRDDLDRAKG